MEGGSIREVDFNFSLILLEATPTTGHEQTIRSYYTLGAWPAHGRS